jgi:single-strand DNA-binding protein
MSKGTVNKAILIGHLGADPDLRSTAGGTTVANISVATTESFKDKDGSWEDKTEWHRVVAFGKSAEFLGNYATKGRKVYIEGRIQTKQWEDNEGVKRYTTEVIAREVQLLDKNPDGNQSGERQPQGTIIPNGSIPPSTNPDDDIPF